MVHIEASWREFASWKFKFGKHKPMDYLDYKQFQV